MDTRASRQVQLREGLDARRRELEAEMRTRVHSGRATRAIEGRDDLEQSEAATQGDISFALLQIRAETLARIEAAIVRLDAGQYGSCVECEEPIAARRLQALPFAVRCQSCEADREKEQGLTKRLTERGFSPFPDAARS